MPVAAPISMIRWYRFLSICRSTDAHAFSIPASRVFMSRMLMNMEANVPHYPEWNAYLKNRQPKTLIVWGRNDPFLRRRPLRARRERRRDRRGDHRDALQI